MHRLELRQAVLVIAVVICLAAPAVSAQQPEYFQTVNQTEFATAVYAAILDVVRANVDPEHALWSLQTKGLLDSSWGGEDTVTVGEAVRVFDRMGIQLSLDVDDDSPLPASMLETILRDHRGAIKRNRLQWDVKHKFSRGITLGVYRERIISASGF